MGFGAGCSVVLIFLPKLKSENVGKHCLIDKIEVPGRLMVCDETLLRLEFSLQLRFPGVLLTVLMVYAAKLNVLNH